MNGLHLVANVPRVIRAAADPDHVIDVSTLRWLYTYIGTGLTPGCDVQECVAYRANSMWADSEGHGYSLCQRHEPYPCPGAGPGVSRPRRSRQRGPIPAANNGGAA